MEAQLQYSAVPHAALHLFLLSPPFFLYIFCSFLLHAFSFNALLPLAALPSYTGQIMTCHVSSCACMWTLFICVCVCVYLLHVTPPTISADHLLAAFFLLPLFVSSFSFGTFPLQEAEKTVWMTYVIARIAVALVPCVKSTSSKSAADLTSRFSVLLFSSRWSSLIAYISSNRGLAFTVTAVAAGIQN